MVYWEGEMLVFQQVTGERFFLFLVLDQLVTTTMGFAKVVNQFILFFLGNLCTSSHELVSLHSPLRLTHAALQKAWRSFRAKNVGS